MAMPANLPITTVDQLLDLPEDPARRHELLTGEYRMTPTPRPAHQRLARALGGVLEQALGGRNDVEVFSLPGDIRLGPDTLVEPDVFVLPVQPGRRLETWADAPVPVLVAEIVSPSTARRDRGVKRHLYLDAGVEEYWVVDLDARLVERWRPGDERPEIVHGELRWRLSNGASGQVDLLALFEEVEGRRT